jgi:hypothetical protein
MKPNHMADLARQAPTRGRSMPFIAEGTYTVGTCFIDSHRNAGREDVAYSCWRHSSGGTKSCSTSFHGASHSLLAVGDGPLVKFMTTTEGTDLWIS